MKNKRKYSFFQWIVRNIYFLRKNIVLNVVKKHAVFFLIEYHEIKTKIPLKLLLKFTQSTNIPKWNVLLIEAQKIKIDPFEMSSLLIECHEKKHMNFLPNVMKSQWNLMKFTVVRCSFVVHGVCGASRPWTRAASLRWVQRSLHRAWASRRIVLPLMIMVLYTIWIYMVVSYNGLQYPMDGL